MSRYKAVFTPVGWQVVDTQMTRDPVAEFGTGDGEYARAIEEAARQNAENLENQIVERACELIGAGVGQGKAWRQARAELKPVVA